MGINLLSSENRQFLLKAGVGNAIQFLESSYKKLLFAYLELVALRNIKKEYEHAYGKWSDEHKNDFPINFPGCDFTYFNIKISDEIAIFNVTFSCFSHLHCFFDNYAQFLNITLLSKKHSDRDDVTFKKIVEKLMNEAPYKLVAQKMLACIDDSKFKYIEDYNNIIKHQYNIYPESIFNLNDGVMEVKSPEFVKSNLVHEASELESKMHDSYEFAKSFFEEATQEIYNILKVQIDNKNTYTR